MNRHVNYYAQNNKNLFMTVYSMGKDELIRSLNNGTIDIASTFLWDDGKACGYIKALSLCLVLSLVLEAVPVTALAAGGTSDTSWYSDGITGFTLSTADQLAVLTVLVYSDEKSFQGQTIQLANDIRVQPFRAVPPMIKTVRRRIIPHGWRARPGLPAMG